MQNSLNEGGGNSSFSLLFSLCFLPFLQRKLQANIKNSQLATGCPQFTSVSRDIAPIQNARLSFPHASFQAQVTSHFWV